ncbi:hypothetical protein HanPI659440_Chr13g0495771 [Helianthus annuus]|nr:hypothetical protein HanPI659440_Chr13g0495771 [Helianthus annuus]
MARWFPGCTCTWTEASASIVLFHDPRHASCTFDYISGRSLVVFINEFVIFSREAKKSTGRCSVVKINFKEIKGIGAVVAVYERAVVVRIEITPCVNVCFTLFMYCV